MNRQDPQNNQEVNQEIDRSIDKTINQASTDQSSESPAEQTFMRPLNQSAKSAPVAPVTKKSKALVVILSIGLVLTLAALAYMAWQFYQTNEQNKVLNTKVDGFKQTINDKQKQEAEQDPQAIATDEVVDPKPVRGHGQSQSTIENIAAVLNTMDTQPMLYYFADQVALVYNQATPSATDRNREQAAKSLEYVNDAKTPWNFFLTAAKLDSYRQRADVAKYFAPHCLVGESADAKRVVSFCYNEAGKIDTIFYIRL